MHKQNNSKGKTMKPLKERLGFGKIDKRNRDNEGKFVSGSGGMKVMQKVQWGRVLPVLLVVALVGGFLVFQSMAAPPSGVTWKQVWSDEFTSSAVDTSKWNVAQNSTFGDANKQDECNRAGNVSVERSDGSGNNDGYLVITGKKEPQGITCGKANPQPAGGDGKYYFSSGLVTTRAQEGPLKYKYKHGYIEARIKSPKGIAYWPAFWLVGPNDGSTPGHPQYGEFDVYEGLGGRPDSYIGTAHFGCDNNVQCITTGTNMYNFKTGSTYNGTGDWGSLYSTQASLNGHQGPSIFDFQTYGFEWDKDQIAWYINGKKIRYLQADGKIYALNNDGKTFRLERTLPGDHPSFKGRVFQPDLKTVFNYDHSIILNLAIGGNMPTGDRGGYTGNEAAATDSNGTVLKNSAGKIVSKYNEGNLNGDFPGKMLVDYVRVYQKDGSGNSAPVPPAKLTTPTGLKVSPADKSAVVSWTKSTDARTNQYQVRYRTGAEAWASAPRSTTLATTVTGLVQGKEYEFQVQALDSSGVNPASDYTASVKAAIPLPEVTGLRAAYFPKTGFASKAVYKIDPNINFDLGWEPPFAGHDADFHVRWSGRLIAPVTGTYTFTTISDDGINVWLNGKRVIESWKDQYRGEKSVTMQLTAGQSYDIMAEYYDSGAGSFAQLLWQYPGITRQVVPSSAFRPVVKTGLSGRYHSAKGVLERNDKKIDFDWGTSALGEGITADNVLVNWVGSITVPTTGEYTFTSLNDDGFNLFIDGNKIIDDWTAHSAKENSGKIRLEAGKEYAINAAYFEKTGSATARFYWTGPGIAKSIIPESALRAN